MSIYQADEWAPAATPEPAETGPGQSPPAAPAGHQRPSLPRLLARGIRELPRRSVARSGRLPLRWRITAMAVAAAAAAAAGTAAAQLAGAAHRDEAVAGARSAALTAATAELRQILSYDYRSIGADLARARSDTTGQFRGQFGLLASRLIGPAAIQQHTVTTATVPDASVVSATADRVVVLLFIDQRTTSKAQPQPQFAASQVRVTMARVAGRWLVAQFQAL